VKPVSEFYPREDGITDYRCKDCTTAGMKVAGEKARRAAGMEIRRFREVTAVESVEGQVCFLCGKWKPLTDYYIVRNKRDNYEGPSPVCKACTKGALKVRRREQGVLPHMPAMGENPQLKALRQIRFQQAGKGAAAYRKGKAKDPERYRNYTNQRRALELGAPVNDLTGEQVAEMMAEQVGVCSYCHLHRPPLVVEHIVPLARGGSHTRWNVTGACQPCNNEKYNRTPEEWREARARKERRMGSEPGSLGVIYDPRDMPGWGQPKPTPA
jgi:5-methylcytosine-specific restriction endonuclease McrA